MLFHVIFLFFISVTRSINTTSKSYVDLQKCCEVDSAFVKQNNTFLCTETENKRVVIQTDFLDVDLNNSNDYECVEAVDMDLLLFKRTLSDTTPMENISNIMLQKCCPKSFFYDPTTHSCTQTLSETNIKATFFKVGLPNCQIIYDYEFQYEDDIPIVDNVYISKKGERIGWENFCIDETVNNNYVVRVCQNFDICKSVMCVHKCCPDGQSFVNGSHCKDTYVHGMDLSKFSNTIANTSAKPAIIHGYKTKLYIPRDQKYHIDDRGNFYTYDEKLGNEFYSPKEETYCIEHATKNDIVFGHLLFRMSLSTTNYIRKKFLFNRWAMVFSNIFLLATVSYYVYSKEIRKVFGKTLVSFCTGLFTLFSILIYCTFNPNMSTRSTMVTCKIVGFMLIYLGLSCFVWLQVMCYDIYWTFGSSKRYSSFNNRKKRDLKRFICYSLYGWGVPLVMILILIAFHFTDVLPPSIQIKMGETKCLIERDGDNYAEILFYIIPLTLIQSVNIVFFIKTVRYCLQVKSNIQKMNQSVDVQKKKNKFRARKERFGLVIKLSIIMGFFYLFEVVSSFFDFQKNVITEHVEIIWDFINCLQGFFIFIIFVCKMKFLKKCSRQAAMERIRKISDTYSTRTTVASSERKSNREGRKYSKEEEKNKFG